MATTHIGGPLRIGDVATRPYPDFGAETSPYYTYNIVPITLSATNFRAAASIAAAGSLVLTATAGVTQTTVNGQTRFVMDVPRNLRFTSAGNDTGITFTVSGFDVYGTPMTETITGANAAIASGLKAFFSVVTITASGASAGTVSIGTGDVFGLPYFVRDAGMVIKSGWDNTLLQNAGTFTGAASAVPSATTGDVRGTFLPTSASNGTRRLVLTFFIENSDVANHATTTGSSLYGRVQF